MPASRSEPPSSRRDRRRLERAERPPGHVRRTGRGGPRRRTPSIAVVSLLAVLAGIGAIAALQLGGPRDEADPAGDLVIPPATIPASVVVDGDAAGSPDAPIVVEIYADYQCPVCARFAREYLGRLVAEFVVPGHVRVVERAIAFLGTGDPDESEQAAIGAACAGEQDRYWAYHDLLLWNQRGENRGAFAAGPLAAMADAAGLDRATWDACVAEPARLAAIRKSTADAAALGIASTPTIVIDGVAIVGMPRTYDDLAATIRERLALAAGAGVP